MPRRRRGSPGRTRCCFPAVARGCRGTRRCTSWGCRTAGRAGSSRPRSGDPGRRPGQRTAPRRAAPRGWYHRCGTSRERQGSGGREAGALILVAERVGRDVGRPGAVLGVTGEGVGVGRDIRCLAARLALRCESAVARAADRVRADDAGPSLVVRHRPEDAGTASARAVGAAVDDASRGGG